MSAVSIRNVSKAFNEGKSNQVDALREVSLDVEPGEFVSLIGPSGCGKSTLLRLIANLLEPTAGEVAVNGKSATQARLDQDYGMAFQQAGLFDWRTVRKNIELPLELKGWDKSARRARAEEMLQLVQLPEFADHYPWQLSGGMQQRLQIARNLVTGPRLVFMDEPTGGLDVSVQARLLDLLRGLVREMGLSAIIVTHDLAVVRLLADRLMVMKDGRVVEQGLTDQVLDDPQHGYTQLLVSSVLQV